MDAHRVAVDNRKPGIAEKMRKEFFQRFGIKPDTGVPADLIFHAVLYWEQFRDYADANIPISPKVRNRAVAAITSVFANDSDRLRIDLCIACISHAWREFISF